MEEDRPKCHTVRERRCISSSRGPVCRKIPRKICTLDKVNATRSLSKTECRNELVPVCGKQSCPLVKTEPKCQIVAKEVELPVPETKCKLVPRKKCETVTQLVPRFEKVEKCFQEENEICETIMRPVVEKTQRTIKWCGEDTRVRK